MRKGGFSLAEVMVAVVVVFLLSLPIIYITTSTKKDTAHAINYLRAVELGNEVLDLVNSLRFEQISEEYLNNAFGGSVTDASNVENTVNLLVRNDTINESWKDTGTFLADSIQYPLQYAQYCFYRKIEVNPSDFGSIRDDTKVIRVTIAWAESSKVNNVNGYGENDGRNKKVVLHTIVGRDRDFCLNNSL